MLFKRPLKSPQKLSQHAPPSSQQIIIHSKLHSSIMRTYEVTILNTPLWYYYFFPLTASRFPFSMPFTSILYRPEAFVPFSHISCNPSSLHPAKSLSHLPRVCLFLSSALPSFMQLLLSSPTSEAIYLSLRITYLSPSLLVPAVSP